MPMDNPKMNKPSSHLNFYRSFSQDLREYLLTSTLHGLRYIGEKKLTWFERFFWLIAFGSSLICAGFFILNVYAKWRMSPMIVSINPENMPLHKLPFPALTICNVNQAKKSVAERYKKFGDSIDKKLLESLCSDQTDADIFEDNIAGNADWDHTRSFLINVTQPCNEMLSLCIWNSASMNCQDLFNAQLTDEGLCCTFNVVHRENMFRNPRDLNDMNITFPLPSVDWTPESGFPDNAPADGFPWRAKGIGTDHGLTLVLDANVAEYYCASTKSPGFKILLHNPTETPNIAKLGEVYGPGIEARVAIQPRILDAQPSLKFIDVNKRLCLFSSEKKLVFYRTYTLRNCEMECEARIMLDVCKCVLYYMPRRPLDSKPRPIVVKFTETAIRDKVWFAKTKLKGTGVTESEFLTKSRHNVFLEARKRFGINKCWTRDGLIHIIAPDGSRHRAECLSDLDSISTWRERACEECLPACTEISYFERPSSAMLSKFLVGHYTQSITLAQNKTAEYFTENMLVIHFYFEDNSFMRFTKGEIFGLTEFLSNTGGLLGLCMGFSMMSAVELLYYITLRVLCVARQSKSIQPFNK
ncbi:pickpocket protein 28-like [Vanessa atalanta]|uniref:pickpocket protein 28-like n=1 Tax=Vanessa atalanta TaxID=42275 RepID=UPI001FCE2906|nr:pickpocket protein 28-like [Vanessa atalanta]